uniref:Uncharacterized protein n=1 Tax=Romanomermis culicivorax TaxID=13658 RepID=A0A915JR88_ROMCU
MSVKANWATFLTDTLPYFWLTFGLLGKDQKTNFKRITGIIRKSNKKLTFDCSGSGGWRRTMVFFRHKISGDRQPLILTKVPSFSRRTSSILGSKTNCKKVVSAALSSATSLAAPTLSASLQRHWTLAAHSTLKSWLNQRLTPITVMKRIYERFLRTSTFLQLNHRYNDNQDDNDDQATGHNDIIVELAGRRRNTFYTPFKTSQGHAYPYNVFRSPSMPGGVDKFSTTPSMVGEQIFCPWGSAGRANVCSASSSASSLLGAVLADHLRAQLRACLASMLAEQRAEKVFDIISPDFTKHVTRNEPRFFNSASLTEKGLLHGVSKSVLRFSPLWLCNLHLILPLTNAEPQTALNSLVVLVTLTYSFMAIGLSSLLLISSNPAEKRLIKTLHRTKIFLWAAQLRRDKKQDKKFRLNGGGRKAQDTEMELSLQREILEHREKRLTVTCK